jgi:PAS domain S-box-containing protein
LRNLRSRPRWSGHGGPDGPTAGRGYLSVVPAALLGVVAIAGALFFHHVEVDALSAQTQLVVVSEQLNRQDALEWRAVTGLVPLPSIRENLTASRAQAGEALNGAGQDGLASTRVKNLRRLSSAYSDAVDLELDLLNRGETAEAQEHDAARVDPAFAAIQPELKTSTGELKQRRSLSSLIHVGGVVGTFALCLLGVGLLERRRFVTQGAAERLSQARYRAVIDHSRDLVWILGRRQQVWYASPAAHDAGWVSHSVDLVDLVHPDDRAAAAALTAHSIDDGTQYVDLRLRHVRLGWRTCEVSVTVLHGPAGDETVIVGHDVTDRAQAQEVLAGARDDAVDASRAKSMFLATMSHEIRTPMNGVIGLTGLLLDTSLDELQRQYAEGVRGAGEALLAVINDILDFSKLEAGKVELEVSPFDPRRLLEEIGTLLAPTAFAKGLELIAYCQPTVPDMLSGDAGRIRQVLLNLASNAVKFTEQGEVVIKVAAISHDDGPVKVRFEVSDTGIGIAEHEQAGLFESFSQADASTTRRFGGTGLGLAISLRLVEAMQGRIDLSSTLGVGSSFSFVLPLAAATRAPGDLAVGFTYDLLPGMRVLVVDDNATNRLILTSQLTSWRLQPEAAENAESALAQMRRRATEGRPFDIAVVDMCMPTTDGLQLAQAISRDPGLHHTKMIMLTSTFNLDLAAVQRAGVREWLNKPVRGSELYDRLMRLMAPDPPVLASSGPNDTIARNAQGRLGRILVVEDNRVNQLVAEGFITRLGYQVDIVGNGIEAVEAVAHRSYAAVLMDCHMPLMDGFEATAEIRRREAPGQRIPIIAITAAAMPEDREQCLAAGMDDYVSKPFDIKLLETTLAQWVGPERPGNGTSSLRHQ